ncbi:hypothetical protein D5085_15450 [Ectothiorhodospiraceae bacterium BW-2]|nr:hypothetical protein D5085_15450 [Ectothiorhodospiraceae bacterium BW-2]
MKVASRNLSLTKAGSESDSAIYLGAIMAPYPALSDDALCIDAESWLKLRPDAAAIPVVDSENSPIGIISRTHFQIKYLQLYGRDIYRHRSVSVMMDHTPFTADYFDSVAQVSTLFERNRNHLIENGILVTQEGLYCGFVSGLALLKSALAEVKLTKKQLEQAQQALIQREKMAYLGSLVAGVAHEVNTPIGIAVTAASTLQDEAAKLVDLLRAGQLKRSLLTHFSELVSDSTALIHANLSRANEIIRNFKSIAVDQTSNELRTFELGEYCQQLLDSMKPTLCHYPQPVRLNSPHQPIVVTTSPSAISQIITNLVLNALEHAFDSESGSEQSRHGSVEITLFETKGSIHLICQDSGKGIEEAIIGNIFDPFFTTLRHRGGSGLGLHIVYNLVTDVLHGEIAVESNSALGGTRFTIIFPI